MTLNDVRKYAIKSRSRVSFSLRGGETCVITEQGLAKVPGVNSPPAFNLEEELRHAARFRVETVVSGKEKAKSADLDRAQLAAQTGGAGAAEAHDEHEE